jgi:hypothetical protein
LKFRKIFCFLFALLLPGCIARAEVIVTQELRSVQSPTDTQTRTALAAPTDKPHPDPLLNQTLLPVTPREIPVQTIPLAGTISSSDAEISGMAWYGDTLVILPQYPEVNLSDQGYPSLFALTKNEILEFLEGTTTQPLTPTKIPFIAPDIAGQIHGYEGYEAIAFDGDQVYLTIEANNLGTMTGYLISGVIQPDINQIQLDPSSLTLIPTQTQIFNTAYEALLVAGDQIITFFESNGAELNSDPSAYHFDKSTFSHRRINFTNIEYRLTDASVTDEHGRFWVANVYFPIELWFYASSDPLSEKYGQGETHSSYLTVERMLELQYDGESINLTDTQPVQLELIDDFNSRNWEALALLDDLGFLAMTDSYPETIFGFIPYP